MRTRTPSGSALQDAVDLYRQPGPVTSLYLSLDAVDDPRGIDLRWRHSRSQLAASGAPESDLRVLDEQVAAARADPGPRVLAAFVADARLLAAHSLERCDEYDLCRYGSLAAGGPFLAWAQRSIGYLVVVTDHTGADISVRRWPAIRDGVSHVEGSHDEIVRTAAGGWRAWSQARYQRRVVDSWEHNATEVAEAVSALARESAAELVLITGDIRSVRMMHDALPQRLQSLTRIVEGGSTRDEEGWSPALDKHLLDAVESTNHATAVALIAAWRSLEGQGRLATAGARATASALRAAKVATLLIGYDSADRRTTWLGPDRHQVALTFAELAPLDLPVHRVPLADAFIGAALATGADVRVVPGDLSGELPDGVGAVLRFP